MKGFRKKILVVLILEAIVFLPWLAVSQNRISSREMEQAIRLYQEGKDNDAMDRFMDILVKGSPSEKALANDYINRITMRMNTGIDTTDDSSNAPVREIPSQNEFRPKIETQKYIEKSSAESEKTKRQEKEATSNNVDVAKKIFKKIEEMRKGILLSISKVDSFKIYMEDQNTPVAVLINEDEIFSSGITFKPKAIEHLQSLASLIFATGEASVMIVPKGVATGEIEIASIRRAIAINSYLTARGLSPARLNVNLTGSNIALPKEVTNVNGILCLFDYKKEKKLKAEDDMKTGGPRVSIGIYPTAISAFKGEGAIVEFSVFEGSGGLPTWKFEIYRVNSDNTVIAIQSVEGQGPKYSQTFFNGREKIFGAYYPSGKYIFSITASDLNGKETTEKRFLLLKPTPEEEKKLSSSNIGKEIKTSRTLASKPIKKTSVATKKQSSYKKTSKKSVSTQTQNLKESTGQVVYKIYFLTGKIEITPNSKKKLEHIASTVDNYPDSRIEITGYAYKKEKNPASMAKKRAYAVKKELINKYGIDPKNIIQKTYVSPTLKTIAEVKMNQE